MDGKMNKTAQMQAYFDRCNELLLKENLRHLLHEAHKRVEEIEPEELAEKLDQVVLIDVREEDEFASGLIPGERVLTIPRGKLEFTANSQILPAIEEGAEVVCYCLKGARGLLAADTLHRLGIPAKNLKGGIENWVQKGYPISNYLGTFKLVK